MSDPTATMPFGSEWANNNNHDNGLRKPLWSGVAAGGVISGSPQSAASSASSSSATLTLNRTGSGRPLEEEMTSGDVCEDSGSATTPVELHMNVDGRKYTAEEMLQIWEHMKNANHFKSSGKSRSELYYSVIPNNPANVLDAQRKSGGDHPHHQRNNHHHSYSRHHHHQQHQSNGSNGSNSHQNDASSSSPPAQAQVQPQQQQSSSFLSSATTTTASSPSSAWSPFRATGPTVLHSNGSSTDFPSFLQRPSTPTGGNMFAATTNARPPPGLGGMAPPGLATLLPPETINWNYRDGAGNEHGPFNGRMMHEWFLGGWLQEDLLIRRSEESEFTTLKDLKLKLGNFSDPFLVPLPPAQQPSNRPLYQPLPQQFSGLQLNQQPMAAGMGGGPWGSHPLPSAGGTISPWDHHQQPFFGGAPMVNHQQPQPAGSLAEENLWPRASPQTPPIQPKASALLNQNASTIGPASAEITRQETPPVGTPKEKTAVRPPQPQPDLEPEPQPHPEPTPVKEGKKSPKEKEVETEVGAAKKTVVEEKAVGHPPEEQATTVVVQEESPEIVEETLQQEEDSEPPKPVLSPAKPPPTAPWAKKDSKPVAPSLKEIQEREAAERKSKAAQKQQLQQKQLQQVTAAAAAAETKNGPTLPSGATWAHTSTTPVAPPKTLAQIQKEEEEARKKAAAATAVPGAAAIAPAGKKYSDIVSPKTSRLAPAPAPAAQTTATNGGSAWTTVGPGGKKASGPPPVPVATATPRTAATPVAKRIATPVTATPKPQKQTSGDEFLQWCKNSIHDLNAGVNQQEMLSILLSLPATPDSKEIIADTIYSNSSTMDGRRFAEEFLKRRKAADVENTSNGETWSEILQRNTNTNKPANEGWNSSFKVVGGKKKNRKAAD